MKARVCSDDLRHLADQYESGQYTSGAVMDIERDICGVTDESIQWVGSSRIIISLARALADAQDKNLDLILSNERGK